MDRYSWLWIAWAASSLAAFLWLELGAVFGGHPSRKLSENLWRLEDFVGYPLIWRLVAGIAVCALFYHLFFGSRH